MVTIMSMALQMQKPKPENRQLERKFTVADLKGGSDGGDDVSGGFGLTGKLAELLHSLHLIKLLESTLANLILHQHIHIWSCLFLRVFNVSQDAKHQTQ